MKARAWIEGDKAIMLRLAGIIYWSLLATQLLVLCCIPLMHMMNDSGWYYMNVHFMLTGEYINESMYPSFHAPSQYYPLLGYSGFLWLCHVIGEWLHVAPAYLIKWAQWLCYAGASLMLKQLGFRLSGSQLPAYLLGLLYLLYLPNLVFANMLMSETLASFLLIAACYAYFSYIAQPTKWTGAILCLFLGYMPLVKTVFLPVALIIFVLLVYRVLSFNRPHAIVLLLFFLFPASQLSVSSHLFHNMKLQSGLGWHLWDRVIAHDQLIPARSTALDSLKRVLAQNRQQPETGYWWNVTRQLSELGYSEKQCQDITLRVALDGIRENPWIYLRNTATESYHVLVYPNEVAVPPAFTAYQQRLEQFCHDPQHGPFCKQMKQQTLYSRFALTPVMMTVFAGWAAGYNAMARLFHHPLIILLFLLSCFISLYHLIRQGHGCDQGLWLIGLCAIAVVVGSVMAEYPQSRLIQPAMPLIWSLPLLVFWPGKRTSGEKKR